MNLPEPSPPQEPTGSDLARAWLEHSPFARLLGITLASIDTDRSELVLPYGEKLATLGDVVHGGAVSAVMDAAAAAAVWSSADPTKVQRGSTASITVNFMAPARAMEIRAEARVTRRGKSLCFCDVRATAGDRLVAQALVTYKLG